MKRLLITALLFSISATAAPVTKEDAIEAFQTFNSTLDVGVNHTAYRDALIQLKVKVDKLPNNEQATSMKKTLEMFVEAGRLWNKSIVGRGSFGGLSQYLVDGNDIVVIDSIKKYPAEWVEVNQNYHPLGEDRPEVGCIHGTGVWATCLELVRDKLIHTGQQNIKDMK